MKKAIHQSECVKETLNDMKSFGGNFGTRSDGIYGVSKMWRVYPNKETRLKRKLVYSYPLLEYNCNKIPAIMYLNV